MKCSVYEQKLVSDKNYDIHFSRINFFKLLIRFHVAKILPFMKKNKKMLLMLEKEEKELRMEHFHNYNFLNLCSQKVHDFTTSLPKDVILACHLSGLKVMKNVP